MNKIIMMIFVTFIISIPYKASFATSLLDEQPRIAVISAFEPELKMLYTMLKERKDYTVNGTLFSTGTIENKKIVLFLSGISMINAAMTTQLVLDYFHIDRIIFSGIAGGTNTNLAIGDVVVPQRWEEYLEMVFARKNKNGYILPNYAKGSALMKNFGMMFPQPVRVIQKGHTTIEKRYWFPVDPKMLAIASQMAENASTSLKKCISHEHCLDYQPKIVIGGTGISGQVFNDNDEFREYVFQAFHASVLDMESAAVAHVAYVNNVPFIAFRSISDLAGGGNLKENEEEQFEQIAADNSAIVVKQFLKALSY